MELKTQELELQVLNKSEAVTSSFHPTIGSKFKYLFTNLVLKYVNGIRK